MLRRGGGGQYGAVMPQTNTPSVLPATARRLVRRSLDAQRSGRVPGLTAGVARHGDLVWDGGFGAARLDLADLASASSAPAPDADTRHQIASNTKTFVAVVVANDTGGYIAGVLFGKHPMAPSISPKKSWEGFAGSNALAIAVGTACGLFLLGVPWWVGALLGVCGVLAGTTGDLAESLIKRDLGLKDMGTILPGHGGIMDRLDSLLVTVPAIYLVLEVAA